MRWKWNLAFNNDDENLCTNIYKKDDENFVQIFTKKTKILFNYPIPTTSHLSVTMSLSEIEIK